MESVRELDPRAPRQIRHTLVRGRDKKLYKVLTFQLYDRMPPPEFHNFEVNVQLVDDDEKFRELFVPYYRRYYSKEEALAHHGELLEKFDDLLQLEAPAEHGKPAAASASEGH